MLTKKNTAIYIYIYRCQILGDSRNPRYPFRIPRNLSKFIYPVYLILIVLSYMAGFYDFWIVHIERSGESRLMESNLSSQNGTLFAVGTRATNHRFRTASDKALNTRFDIFQTLAFE